MRPKATSFVRMHSNVYTDLCVVIKQDYLPAASSMWNLRTGCPITLTITVGAINSARILPVCYVHQRVRWKTRMYICIVGVYYHCNPRPLFSWQGSRTNSCWWKLPCDSNGDINSAQRPVNDSGEYISSACFTCGVNKFHDSPLNPLKSS